MKANKWRAVIFILFSSLCLILMNSFIKYLDEYHSSQIIFFRSIGTFILCLTLLLKNRISILGNQKSLLLARGLIGLVAMSFYFMAIQQMPFGSVISLRYLAPIFATVLAVIILKEKINSYQILCFSIAIIGVIIIKGYDLRVEISGLILVLISALANGFVFIIIRKIGTRDHPLVVVNYFMFITSIVGGIFAFFHWKAPSLIHWGIFISMGILGFLGQYYMTKALQIEKTSVVAPLKYIEIIYALLIGFFWFGETYSALSFLGILLIIVGMFLNVVLKSKG